MAVLDFVAAERIRLADELDLLDADQWILPSLCGEWNNHQVVSHLVVPFRVGMPQFVVGMLKAKGNFDKANDAFAKQTATELTPGACVDLLREKARHPFKPPGFGHEAPLNDVLVHGGDILRPLGRSIDADPDALRTVLEFIVTGAKARKAGAVASGSVSLAPTDLDGETYGSGPVVSGPALSLISALGGRKAFLPDLSGPGVEVLAAR